VTQPSQTNAWTRTVGAYEITNTAILLVQGADARPWLNGQISNDVGLSRANQGTYAIAPSAKGKILSDLWVFDRGDQFYLLIPQPTYPSLVEHFEKYIIMEDVTLNVVQDKILWSLQGPLANEAAQALVLEGMETFTCDRLGYGGVDVLVPSAHASFAKEKIIEVVKQAQGTVLSEHAWELARLRQGIPQCGIDFDEQRYPQEAGIKHRAVSFNKGCYIGQEVISMLEHRGKLKQQLVKIKAASTSGLSHSQPLLDHDNKPVGTITSAVLDTEHNQWIGLAYVEQAHLASRHALYTALGDPVNILYES
jgi:folate-binding protein YgfZ